MSFKVVSLTKDIAAAATPEALSATPILTTTVWLQCPDANTSDLLVGDSTGQFFTIAQGTTLQIGEVGNEKGREPINLADIFVKAGTNGDDVQALYVVRT